jgi:hypothetical protein
MDYTKNKNGFINTKMAFSVRCFIAKIDSLITKSDYFRHENGMILLTKQINGNKLNVLSSTLSCLNPPLPAHPIIH